MAKTITNIMVRSVRPNRGQPRKTFDAGAIQELAATIREHGLLQPILVRRSGGAHGYELVAGERRLRAVRRLGWKTVPAIVMQAGDRESAEMALVENVMREGLHPLEEGCAFRALLDAGESYRGLARKIGKDKGYVQNRVRLLDMPDDVQELVRKRPHMIYHAYELAKVMDQNLRRFLIGRCDDDQPRKFTLSRLRHELRYASQEGRPGGSHPYALWECSHTRDPSDGDDRYLGNCHPSVVERCLGCISGNTLRMKNPCYTLWIPFAGSGTGIETARRIGIHRVIASDINPVAPGIRKADARKSGLSSSSVDCIFAHPPYWNAVKYSIEYMDKGDANDMSMAATLDEYLAAMERFYREARRILKPGGHLFVMIGDIRKVNRLVPLTAHLALMGERHFHLTQRVTLVRNRSSPLTPVLVSNARRRGHLIDITDTILFFRKPPRVQ